MEAEKRQLVRLAPGTSAAGTGGAPGFHQDCGEAWHWCNSRDRGSGPVTQQWGVKVGAAAACSTCGSGKIAMHWLPRLSQFLRQHLSSTRFALNSFPIIVVLSLICCCIMVDQNFYPKHVAQCHVSWLCPKAPLSKLCHLTLRQGSHSESAFSTHGLNSEILWYRGTDLSFPGLLFEL